MTAVIKETFRALVVLVVGLAWFAVSNHCVLAALERPAKMVVAQSCHGMTAQHAPAKKNQTGVECCKVLRATLSKSLAVQSAMAFAIREYFIKFVSLPDETQPKCVFALDTGPPFAYSFSESVLQRSILAHAPPFLA
jgi:hypothetical protein